jgi:uncharacterized membrane protein
MLTNPEIIAALFAGAVSVLGAFFAFSKWMITKFLSELKPNSGSSIKDQVTRLEKRVDEIYSLVAKRSKNG